MFMNDELVFLDCGRKPEYPGRTHTGTGRTCKISTEGPWALTQESNSRTCLLWGDSANHRTTVPPQRVVVIRHQARVGEIQCCVHARSDILKPAEQTCYKNLYRYFPLLQFEVNEDLSRRQRITSTSQRKFLQDLLVWETPSTSDSCTPWEMDKTEFMSSRCDTRQTHTWRSWWHAGFTGICHSVMGHFARSFHWLPLCLHFVFVWQQIGLFHHSLANVEMVESTSYSTCK